VAVNYLMDVMGVSERVACRCSIALSRLPTAVSSGRQARFQHGWWSRKGLAGGRNAVALALADVFLLVIAARRGFEPGRGRSRHHLAQQQPQRMAGRAEEQLTASAGK
jgi:hypothetical protein